jgi:hypothetical protein
MFRTDELPALGETASGRGRGRGRGRAWLALGFAGALAGGVVLLRDAEPETLEAEAGPIEVGPPIVTPTPNPVRTPELAGTVRLHFDTGGVAAQVFDVHGVAVGTTADPAGLELPRSAVALHLTLRAEGHDEQHVSVVPSEDRSVVVNLPIHPGRSGGRRSQRASEPPPVESVKPPPEQPEQPEKPEKPDSKTSPDLISPFGG